MLGGYSIETLVKILNTNLGMFAAEELKNNILIFDYFYNIENLYKEGNPQC